MSEDSIPKTLGSGRPSKPVGDTSSCRVEFDAGEVEKNANVCEGMPNSIVDVSL